jgi:hypothetical protein
MVAVLISSLYTQLKNQLKLLFQVFSITIYTVQGIDSTGRDDFIAAEFISPRGCHATGKSMCTLIHNHHVKTAMLSVLIDFIWLIFLYKKYSNP